MKTNPVKWLFIERRLPIVLGIIEGLAGLILISIAAIAAFHLQISMQPELINLLSDLGIGLLTAGVITGTLEPISRRRMQRDIKEIKRTHFESLLKGFMPEPIFNEVQAHIIRQPFLRTNFHVTRELGWEDETREYLKNSLTFSYDVENVSRTLENYELYVGQERVNEDKFPGTTRIQMIRLQSSRDLQSIVYSGDDLEKFMEKTDQFISARIPVMLEPGQKVNVVARMSSMLESRDVYTFLVVTPTMKLDLTVAHPKDLSIQAIPNHPSIHAFKTEVDAPTLKRWRIDAGLLPYQGIQLSWRPIALTSKKKSEINTESIRTT
jgi:hypothetical protein